MMHLNRHMHIHNTYKELIIFFGSCVCGGVFLWPLLWRHDFKTGAEILWRLRRCEVSCATSSLKADAYVTLRISLAFKDKLRVSHN